MSKQKHRRPLLWAGLGLGIIVFCAVIGTIIMMTIWPGEAKLTAPLFCSDDRPQALVVRDTYSNGTGETAINFTLYCIGDRGNFENVGWFKPMAVLSLVHFGLLVIVVFAVTLWVRFRKRQGKPGTITIDLSRG